MSLMRIMEMRNSRAALVAEGRAVLDKAVEEKRDMNAEERVKYDKILADGAALKESIDREEKQLALENEMRDLAGKPGAPSPKQETTEERKVKAFRNFLVGDCSAAEYRDLVNDTGLKGGFLHPPEQYVTQLLKGLDDLVFIRPFANTIKLIQNDTLGIPTLAQDLSDPTWTTEVAQVDLDTQMEFGKRHLFPKQLSKRVLVSMKLLQTAQIPVDSLVSERMAQRFAITLENAFLNGSGTGEPLGVFTADPNGIDTDRDVSDGNTATEITADGLINAKYALKQQYRNRNTVRWAFHREAVREIAKLKDSDGQYIWRPGIVANEPDRLLNIPVDESEFAPNVFTSGLYVGILADWSYYYIAELQNMEMQRLNELYAETSQVGFIGRGYWDGAPVMPAAFARVTLA